MSIVQAARDHLEHALHVLGSALVSRGMIYPFQGIIYLIAHPSLHKAVYPVFWRLILTSVVIGVGLLLTLPIQSAFVFFLGPLAPIVAFLLILAEFCVAALVVSRVLFGAIQDSLFDAVLLQQGLLPDPVISLQKAEALGLRLKGINARAGLKTRESLIEKARKRINMNALIRFIVSIPL